MPRFCDSKYTGLDCDLLSIMNIDPIVDMGDGKPFFLIYHNNGHKEKVSLINLDSHPSQLHQIHRNLVDMWKNYRRC